ncbi:MAG: hypothetical protein KGL39_14525 [Patescibacteria group bacterium]|nr:hypothetical protein [Patescibacteria group bacterium]
MELKKPPRFGEDYTPEKAKEVEEHLAKEAEKEAKKMRRAAENYARLKALPKRKGPRMKGSWYVGKWARDDINNLPPLPMDENGILKQPKKFSVGALAVLREPVRKVAWLQWYNWSGGSIMYACQESGITKKMLRDWLKTDKVFAAKINDVRLEIADRLQFKMAGHVGLVKMSGLSNVSEAATLSMMRSFKNEPFSLEDVSPEEHEDKNSLTHNIPRQGWAPEQVGQTEGSPTQD